MVGHLVNQIVVNIMLLEWIDSANSAKHFLSGKMLEAVQQSDILNMQAS